MVDNRYCSIHNEKYSYFCLDKTCKAQNRLCCPQCIIKDSAKHFGHSNIEIQQVNKNLRAENSKPPTPLQSHIQKIEKQMRYDVEDRIKEIRRRCDRTLSDMKTNLLKQIKEVFKSEMHPQQFLQGSNEILHIQETELQDQVASLMREHQKSSNSQQNPQKLQKSTSTSTTTAAASKNEKSDKPTISSFPQIDITLRQIQNFTHNLELGFAKYLRQERYKIEDYYLQREEEDQMIFESSEKDINNNNEELSEFVLSQRKELLNQNAFKLSEFKSACKLTLKRNDAVKFTSFSHTPQNSRLYYSESNKSLTCIDYSKKGAVHKNIFSKKITNMLALNNSLVVLGNEEGEVFLYDTDKQQKLKEQLQQQKLKDQEAGQQQQQTESIQQNLEQNLIFHKVGDKEITNIVLLSKTYNGKQYTVSGRETEQQQNGNGKTGENPAADQQQQQQQNSEKNGSPMPSYFTVLVTSMDNKIISYKISCPDGIVSENLKYGQNTIKDDEENVIAQNSVSNFVLRRKVYIKKKNNVSQQQQQKQSQQEQQQPPKQDEKKENQEQELKNKPKEEEEVIIIEDNQDTTVLNETQKSAQNTINNESQVQNGDSKKTEKNAKTESDNKQTSEESKGKYEIMVERYFVVGQTKNIHIFKQNEQNPIATHYCVGDDSPNDNDVACLETLSFYNTIVVGNLGGDLTVIKFTQKDQKTHFVRKIKKSTVQQEKKDQKVPATANKDQKTTPISNGTNDEEKVVVVEEEKDPKIIEEEKLKAEQLKIQQNQISKIINVGGGFCFMGDNSGGINLNNIYENYNKDLSLFTMDSKNFLSFSPHKEKIVDIFATGNGSLVSFSQDNTIKVFK